MQQSRTRNKLHEFSRLIGRFIISAFKTNLDNLFGPLYEEYYATSSPEVFDNSAANTLDNENTSSSSSIVIEEDDAPQIVSSLAEQVTNEPNSPVLNENADELDQENNAETDGNVFYNAPQTPMFEEAESSSTFQDPSNMHENRLHTDAEVCMYALTVSTIELKNIKEAMLDASWIESMQDELNQFKRLDVWELVECPIGGNIIAPLRDGWTDFLQEPSIPETSLKKPLSKGTVHHQRLLSSLKKSATSSRKEKKHYSKLGSGAHLDKDCPLKKEVKSVEEAKYSEFGRPSPFSNGAKYRIGSHGYYIRIDNRPPFGEKRPSLEELMNKHLEESS
ncbi:hypothetical protein Tco_0132339 [Tanacetum coccineum]